MKFVQITDTHIVPPGEKLYDLDTRERLEACIADINANHRDAELCIITGDLANHGQLAAYENLKQALIYLELPYHLLIGNHDHRDNFKKVFNDVPCDENGFVQSVLDTAAGCFILLDSVEHGERWGSFCEQRAAWLRTQLDKARQAPVYLFIHHPPFEIGIPSLDYIRLRDPSYLREAVKQHRNIKHLFLGHVHRPISGSWFGVPYSMLRSTSHQVCFDFEVVNPVPKSHEPPAYAVVLLNDDTVVVHLHDYLNRSNLPLPDDTERMSGSRRDELPLSFALHARASDTQATR
ncbi:MAG: phosphodiesterase [Acidiferrobacterales bacterium]